MKLPSSFLLLLCGESQSNWMERKNALRERMNEYISDENNTCSWGLTSKMKVSPRWVVKWLGSGGALTLLKV